MTETTAETPFIQLSGVTFAYPGREPVLLELNFDFHKGRRIGLIGPNAGGKTTLLLIIMGLLWPQAGTVLLEGRPIMGEKDFFELRKRVGFLFQHPEDQLFSPTVLEDVAFGPLNLGKSPAQAREIAERTLERLGLAGYGDRITYRLSGGEKKLVALATALAMEPEALLLDEPTNDLDPPTRQRLMDILAGLDISCLIVSHDLDFLARTVGETWVMEEGKISYQGKAVLHTHRHVHTHGDLPHDHEG
jgi:cobalt/nickel transport system ATP-binding protein